MAATMPPRMGPHQYTWGGDGKALTSITHEKVEKSVTLEGVKYLKQGLGGMGHR